MTTSHYTWLKKSRGLCIPLLLLLLCVTPVPAIQAMDAPLYVQQSDNHYVLGAYFSYLEDRARNLDVTDILELKRNHTEQFKPHYNDVINLGFSESAFWFVLSLDFSGTDVRQDEWFLKIPYPMLRTVDLYVVVDKIIIEHQRAPSIAHDADIGATSHPDRYFLFKLPVMETEGKFSIVLRVHSFARMLVPVELLRTDALVQSHGFEHYALGFYFGLMVVMALYQAVIYFAVRERSYLYYVAYIISMIVFFLVLSGLGQQYFWGYSSFVSERMPLVSAYLAMAFSLQFAYAFLSLKSVSSRLAFGVRIFSAMLFLAGIFSLFIPFYMTLLGGTISMLYAALVSYMIFFSWHKASREAKVLFVSFSILLFSVLVYVMSIIGFFPANMLTIYSIYFGSAIQVVFLSLALANQINKERKQQYLALIREHHTVQNQRRREEKSLERAMLDPLSGLPNRAALERYGDKFYDERSRNHNGLIVVMIYLQGYQQINHTLGFRSGDLILERVAKRINRLAEQFENCLPIKLQSGDRFYAARVDSLNFALFFTLQNNREKCLGDIQHLLELINRPIEVHDMLLDIQARAGIAFAPEHSTNIFTLLRFAQAAVEARQNESIPLVLYSNSVSQLATRKLKLISGLRKALQENELTLMFQPQLDIRENKITGVEALCRWEHPEYGNVEAREFVALAESSGLIDKLSDWVIEESLNSLAWFYQRGLRLKLAVNVSAKNLSQHDFVSNLQSRIESKGLSLKVLTIEITEVSLMQDPENAIRVLNALHKKGVAVSIDDFGSAYSSLGYIKQLPVSELKIDSSFVSQLDSFHSDRVITKSTIAMAHEMGARVCAEGVENASCLKILSQFDCDLAQGFFISKPLSKEDFVVWIDESHLMA